MDILPGIDILPGVDILPDSWLCLYYPFNEEAEGAPNIKLVRFIYVYTGYYLRNNEFVLASM